MTKILEKCAVRDMRLASGLTQSQVCELVGVQLRTWQRYEQRGCAPAYVIELLRIKLSDADMHRAEGA